MGYFIQIHRHGGPRIEVRQIDDCVVVDVDGLPLIEWPLYIAASVATAVVDLLLAELAAQ